MSTRSTSSNLFSPLKDPESLIRRRNFNEPSSLFDFEETMSIPHNNQGPPPTGPPPQNNNGPPPVVRPNGTAPDLRSMEELCQPSINGRDGPISPILIQATDFGLRHHMIQQVQNSCQFHGLPGDDANRHTDKFLEVTQHMKQNGVFDDALHLSLFPYSLTHHATDCFIQLHSPSGSGSIPSNTIPNPSGEIKSITTPSGIVLDRPLVPPPPPFSSPKEVEHEPEPIMDQVPTESTIRVPPSVVHLAEALALMPKYHKMLQDLLSDKEKLLGLANTSLTKNCSADLLKKSPKKHGDPGRFLVPYDFHRLESCMALADLGASINLILSVWKKLSLPDLTPTRMTLDLATRSIAYPAGIADDVCVQVGKFTFPADFVVVDYDVDPRVPLIVGRPFLRMAHALVDVHEEELILRDGDEKLIFHDDSTSKHPHKHGNVSINMINFIDITCEDRFPEVLKIKKSNHPSSDSTTPLFDFSPSLTPFETSDSLLEEFADELALLDPPPPGNEDDNFDLKLTIEK
nr:hypothetical protein [Tanacetum cinerariifolium]